MTRREHELGNVLSAQTKTWPTVGSPPPITTAGLACHLWNQAKDLPIPHTTTAVLVGITPKHEVLASPIWIYLKRKDPGSRIILVLPWNQSLKLSSDFIQCKLPTREPCVHRVIKALPQSDVWVWPISQHKVSSVEEDSNGGLRGYIWLCWWTKWRDWIGLRALDCRH